MANHAVAKLPWSVDGNVMRLFASEMMKAAFGGHFVAKDVDDPFGFSQVEKGMSGWDQTTMVWSDSPKHLEMRHGCGGMDRVAQVLEFEGIAASFGAPIANDDGIGDYRVDRPGRLHLLPMRGHCDGFSPKKDGRSKAGKVLALLMAGVHFEGAEGSSSTFWLMSQEQFDAAKTRVDPVFFNPPDVDLHGWYLPGPKRDAYLRAREVDVLHWSDKLDWAAAVDKAYPAGKGMDASAAASALMPSAALDLACSSHALERAGEKGLQRALAVALMWANPLSASAIHGQLVRVASDPDAALKSAMDACAKMVAKRAKCKEGDALEGQSEASLALGEALALSRHAAKPEPKAGIKGLSL